MEQRIKIWKDTDAACPWKDWDCEPPLMYKGGRGWEGDFSNGEIHKAVLEKATYNRIVRHQKRLAEILELDTEYWKDYKWTADDKADEIRNEISKTSLEQLSELCDLFKIPNTLHSSRGYSQGDYAEVLIVLTDEWFENTGAVRKNEEEILESSAKLFDNWAWGDVYGFTIEEKKKLTKTYEDGTTEEDEEWEEVDSCGGFYGDDWETNGILDYVPKELHEQVLNYSYEDIEY